MNVGAVRPELREIPIGLIDEPELPSRTAMDEEKLNQLAADMRVHGFTSVLVVFREGDRFGVVAGHRRTISARRAGVVAVPCLVYPSRVDGMEAIQFSENALREDLSVTDEAIWFAELFERHQAEGTDGVAARTGTTRAYVEGRLSLLHGDAEIFGALARNEITIGVAQQLNRIGSEKYRRMYLELAVTNGATVAIAQSWVLDYKRVHAPATNDGAALDVAPPAPPPPVAEYFTCGACDGAHDMASMIPIQFHRYCVQSHLRPALLMLRERHLYVRRPRTNDEAAALVSELLDQFPALAEDTTARA
ncbi:MAG: ParB/RepB/Spo0J family partition protein [Vicinamibacterales bacterium]